MRFSVSTEASVVLDPHADDPDAVPLSSTDAIEYDAKARLLGQQCPEPDLQLAYGPDRSQRIDVYRPAGGQAGLPVLLFLHGGAWIAGHLGWLRFMAPAALANGFLFVGAGYRLAPRCRWPAQLDDARTLVQFVRRNALDWGGDARRLVIGGHSAGGHLASLVTLLDDPPVLACLPVSSSFDLRYGDVPKESPAGRVYKYLFSQRGQDQEASPIAFAANAGCPHHILWGEHDFERVIDSSVRMVAELRREGKAVTSDVRSGSNHFDTHLALGNADDPWYARVTALAEAGLA